MQGFSQLEVDVHTGRRTGWTMLAIGLLLVAGCASKRVYRQPPPGSADESTSETAPARRDEAPPPETLPEPTPPSMEVQLGIRVATLAHEQVGRPYRWGGESPGQGFDCSGLVHWSYGCVDIGLPRVVRQQKEAGKSITGDLLQPGDLVFFAVDGRSTNHVGIYLGNNRFVHAPSSGQPVRVNSLNEKWWRDRWTDSRRIITG